MSPLLQANWDEINRAFCALCWMGALALAVVVLGVAAGTSHVGSLGRSAQPGPGTGPGLGQVHRRP
jgi:hypothetical protein